MIINGNCIEVMKDMKDGSIDHFYADPPFDIDFTNTESMYNRNKESIVKGYQEPIIDYYEFSRQWIEGVYRLLKKNGSGWVCSGWSNLVNVLRAIDDTGFTVKNHIIWKYQFGVYTKKKFITSHYHILFVIKNEKEWYFDKDCRYEDVRTSSGNENYRDREDVWTIKRPYQFGGKKNANTQPLELVEKALSYTTEPGSLVLDPFLGGGTTATACKNLGRRCIGIEINSSIIEELNRRNSYEKTNKKRQTYWLYNVTEK